MAISMRGARGTTSRTLCAASVDARSLAWRKSSSATVARPATAAARSRWTRASCRRPTCLARCAAAVWQSREPRTPFQSYARRVERY